MKKKRMRKKERTKTYPTHHLPTPPTFRNQIPRTRPHHNPPRRPLRPHGNDSRYFCNLLLLLLLPILLPILHHFPKRLRLQSPSNLLLQLRRPPLNIMNTAQSLTHQLCPIGQDSGANTSRGEGQSVQGVEVEGVCEGGNYSVEREKASPPWGGGDERS